MSENTPNSLNSVVVLISGRGSNLQALLEHPGYKHDYDVVCVISNRPNADGLKYAADKGIPVRVIDHTQYPDRASFDEALRQQIDQFSPFLVVLAGFMRILTDDFVRHYSGRMINIHPSLLPAFPGLQTHQKAIDTGCRVHGATVHFVTPTLDHGPIISQGMVPVLDTDTAEVLANRLLKLEHQLLPAAVVDVCNHRLMAKGLRVKRHQDASPAILLSNLFQSTTH